MIINLYELQSIPELSGYSDKALKRKIKALENLIRGYTNNNFQNRRIRFDAPSSGSALMCCDQRLSVDDTIQITESVNDGLYTIVSIDASRGETVLDEVLFAADYNLITKIDYPPAIVEGVINMLKWELTVGVKVGIQSETISRHSVTYYSQDAANQLMGYPVTLLGFLKPYTRARF